MNSKQKDFNSNNNLIYGPSGGCQTSSTTQIPKLFPNTNGQNVFHEEFED